MEPINHPLLPPAGGGSLFKAPLKGESYIVQSLPMLRHGQALLF